MLLCDLTLRSPQENLACDEALLDFCEDGLTDDLLRFWQPAEHFVVVGYANKVATEVNVSFCRANRISLLRRCTGGGTVLQGPGCLNYSLILRMDPFGPLHSITSTNEYILKRQQAALSRLLGDRVTTQGHTDLAMGGLKFSGNAQRRKKNFLIFHGSFLLDVDISLIEKALPMPSKQPDYRVNRPHSDFLMNLKVPEQQVKAALVQEWNATEPLRQVPFERIDRLVREKYSRDDWNLKF